MSNYILKLSINKITYNVYYYYFCHIKRYDLLLKINDTCRI